jgi:hypothetical protein
MAPFSRPWLILTASSARKEKKRKREAEVILGSQKRIQAGKSETWGLKKAYGVSSAHCN